MASPTSEHSERESAESAATSGIATPSPSDAARTAPSRGQALMMAALSEMRKGHATAARSRWRLALEEYPALRDYHLYYLALADASAGDGEGARRQLETVLRDEPDSVLAPLAALHLGRMLAESEPETARGHLRQARRRLPRGGQAWAKGSLLLARLELRLGETATAHRILRDTRERVGPGIARRRARREARRVAAVDPNLALTRPAQAVEEVRLLLREGAPAEAERVATTALEASPPPGLQAQLLHQLGRAQYEQGRVLEAEATMHDVVAKHAGTADAPNALLDLATWRWNRDDDGVARERFRTFLRRYPRHPRAADALYAIGRIHQAANRFTEARATYEDLGKRFPRAALAAEARWRRCWLYYLERRYAAAAASFARLTQSSDLRESARYWQAKATEHVRGNAAAESLFASIPREFPRGFYAVWAERRLAAARSAPAGVMSDDAAPGARKGDDHASTTRAPCATCGLPRPLALLADESATASLDPERFRRAVDLELMGLRRHALRELEAISFPRAGRTDEQLLLLEAYTRVGRYDRVFHLRGISRPRKTDAVGQPLDRFLFPRAYWDLLQKHGASPAVDPYLVAALMHQESRFTPEAVSPKGARGLMQLMPGTAARMARRAGHPTPRERDLERPEVNIQYGMAYLAELTAKYGNATHKVLAAYNAGEDAVARWERRFGDAEPDEFVERITYRETRDYVKAVMRNYRIYRILYGDADPAAVITDAAPPVTAPPRRGT